MLTTALNFLSDKRKRFHRSDTMPIFTNDTSSFKLNSDNQLVENDELSVKDKDCNNEEQQEVGIVSARGYKKMNNLDKYKFLDLETNLQRHQKNLSNSPPRENIPYGHLSHGYSLSNVQVTSNQTGSETSVFSSANLLKKGFGGENSTLKGGKIHNIRFIRPPVELNESQPLISGDLDNEQMSYTSSKTNSSGKSKVAKMRARAAARAAKGKLKRSKSSAYMSRQFRNPPLEDSSIRGRSSSTHRKSNNNNLQENQSLQNSTENKSRSGLVRGWIDKNASTKLDSSLQSNIQTGNLSEIVDISEGFDQLINKANTYKFQIINALEHSKSLTESKEISNELQTDQKTSCLTDNQYAPKILSSRQVIASTNSTVKPNRYSVVRKLRRNNSSITCSSEQISTLHEDQSIVSTNSTAGDLLLPSKNYKTDKFTFEEKDENAKNLIVKLFTIIKYDDFDQFIKLLDHYQRLSEPSLRQVQKATNEFGLSALDSAHLTSSLPLISCLLVCGFLPGPVLQPILNSSTKSYSHKIDTMGRYLENLLEEKEIQLTKYKVETKNAILRANHLSKIEMQKDFSSSIQLNQQCEQFNNSNNTIAFAELIDNYSKYPRYTKPPSKVNIFLNSSNSILIRITPPKNDRFTEISLQNSTGKATSDDDNNNNDNNPLGDTRSEYEINFDQSSCDSTDDNNNDNNDDINLIQDSINEGRKINDVNKIHSNNFILRYCIEWSTCPKFSNSQVYSYLVQPPIRINRPHSQAINKVNQSTSLRVGFYCINNLPENKMIFIRVFAFSIRGWSQPCYAYPKGLVLSSWITNKICDLYRTTIQRDNSLSLSYTKYVGGTLDEEISTVKNHLCQQLSSWAHNYPVNSNVNCNTANPAAAATTITTAVATVPSSSSSTTTTTTTTGVPVNISEETTSKRTKSPMLQRKRSFRFPFSNKGLKFIRQTKSGVYLAVLYHTPTISSNITSSNESEKFKYKSKIVLADDYIPILNISREDQTNESVLNSDFNWLSRIVSDSFYDMDIQFLYEDIPNTSLPTNLQLRVRLLETLQRLKLLLGTSNLGSIYPEIIRVQTIDTCLTNYLKQPKHETLDNCENASTPKVSTETNDSTTTSTSYSELHKHLLEPGLYVVHVQMKAHLDQQAAILVSNTPSVIHMLPAEKIRSRSHVSYSEWYSLCRLVEKTDEKTEENFFNFKNSDKRFIIQLIKAIFKLANRLCYDINDMKMFRIFLPEIIRISPVHAFILLFPSIDQVCVPPTLNTPPPPTCSWIPMTYFERNLGLNYDPLFHNKIQHLISLLELIIPLSQFAQRQCLTESNLSQLSERTQSLQSIQTNLENMFQTRRWLSETISVGRDRKKLFHFHINLEQILNEYHSILKTTLIKLNLDSLTDETIEFNKASRIAEPATALMITDKTKLIRSSSVHSDLADTLPTSERVDINNLPSSPAEPKYKVSNAVIQVYADYPTGLTSGVSVRLLINMRTTVKEVIEIVVKQLLETAERKYNKASDNSELSSALSSFEMLRNNTESNLENHLYCLTVSVGQLERCLPNTVRLLLLRRPWRFGKLTIRLVNNLSESISQQKLPSSSSQEPTSPSSELTNFPSAVDKSISPLVRVTYVEPNLKQASITSPPEVLH
ncbi:unnamed protein product [Trichobilharzia regenti]|nr:unnamed protein product [Trichobilharzia regenti]